MKKKYVNATSILESWISIFFALIWKRLRKPEIKLHNGNSIFEYPEKNWYLVPFPKQKGSLFNADNLATVNRHEFLNDQRFKLALQAAEIRWGKPGEVRDISWRLHTIIWASKLALNNFKLNDAIFLECGTGKGYMAAGICMYHDFNEENPNFYLADTFISHLERSEGNSSPAEFAYSDGDIEVRNYFSKYKNVNILKGRVPEILQELPNKPIIFLHLDLNDETAEYDALKFLKDRFVKGSIIIFDDYGGFGGHDQAVVHEKFSKDMNIPLLVLPTGQAILIF